MFVSEFILILLITGFFNITGFLFEMKDGNLNISPYHVPDMNWN